MTHSPSLATNKRSTTREHLLDELKQAAVGEFLVLQINKKSLID
jgi:hypothetical protein